MWKIWLMVGLAGIVAIMTAIMGILHQMKFGVILQRTITSILVAGCAGYVLGVLIERVGLPYLRGDKSAGLEQGSPLAEGAADETDDEKTVSEMEIKPEFAPFTADNLDRVSPPNT